MKYSLKKVQGSQWLLMMLIFIAAAAFYLLDIFEESNRKSFPTENINVIETNRVPGFLVHTEGCRIPEMDPYDSSILKYLSKKPRYKCGLKPSLIESNQTSINVVEEALQAYNVTDINDLNCCYSPFWRKKVKIGSKDRGADNKIEISKICTPFSRSADISDEYIEVTCKVDDAKIYTDFHAFIVPKENNSNIVNYPESENPSVLIIGADSVSRLNFYRQMPKTKTILNNFKAIEFFGYNKVADNTFPNLVPILTGHTVEEIQTFCWKNNDDFFDGCPWIWKNYSARGYGTALGEDAYWMGSFNYLKNGFSQPPVDYYLRSYIKANEDMIGHLKLVNAKICVGPRLTAQILFDYAYKFSSNFTLSDKKFWAFFWQNSLTHDFLNVSPDVDDIYSDLLLKLKMDNVLEKTIVVFVSDHGIRWGGIRETFQGRVEERLPFLFVLLPERFKEKYVSAAMNLHRNKNMLTSPFDLHETLKDLLDLNRIEQKSINKRAFELNGKRGISLFLPIPRERTCQDAGIPHEWCVCHQSKNISVEDEKVGRAAQTVVDHINEILFRFIQCARLSLKQVVYSRVETSSSETVLSHTKDQYTDYIVIVVTEPGDAKFEATVRHRSYNDSMKVQGYISRINSYGSQSKCILDYRLRLYCYCH